MENSYYTIQCLECNKLFKHLSSHLNRTHKMTVEEYKQKHNVNTISSQYLIDNFSKNNPRKNVEIKNKAIKTFKINRKLGIHQSWNEGLTKETNESLMSQSLKIKGRTKENDLGRLIASIKNSGENNPSKRPEVRAKIKFAIATRSEEKRKQKSEKIRLKKLGVPRLDMRGENNPGKRPEVRAKLRAATLKRSKEIRAKAIASGKASPNYPERILFEIINKLYPGEYALNPRGEIITIGGKKPDIVNINGQKKIIEHFGRHWHKPEDEPKRIKFMKQFGFNSLIIWNEELKNKELLIEKIIKFHLS